MRRPAVLADLERLIALRDAAGAEALSDPALVGDADLRRLIAAGSVIVWDESGQIAGFAAIDGATIHLLVDPAQRGKGIGRDLLTAACTALKQAGRDAATLNLAPGSIATRHYLAAGWVVAGETAPGGIILKKPL
jgi:GNAT superfamily N-acetyltransferase